MDEDFGYESGFDDIDSSSFETDSFNDVSTELDFSTDVSDFEGNSFDEFNDVDISLDDTYEDIGGIGDLDDTQLDFELSDISEDDFIEMDSDFEISEDNISTIELSDVDSDTDFEEIELDESTLDEFEDFESFDKGSELDLDLSDTDDFSEDSEVLELDDSSDIEMENVETIDLETLVDDSVDSLLFSGNEGFIEDFPNELEVYAMNEAQTETSLDIADEDSELSNSVEDNREDPIFEEHSPVTSEEAPEQEDACDLSDLSADDTSMEVSDLNADEVVDEEGAEVTGDLIEATDSIEKTPYEALRDYIYEHNYGQGDYPEYSQDPEWQELNQNYMDSLENQGQAEVSDGVVAEEIADDSTEAIEITEKTPYEALRDHIYDNNYTREDYPEYSQGPEWQELNQNYMDSLENQGQTEMSEDVLGLRLEEVSTTEFIGESEYADEDINSEAIGLVVGTDSHLDVVTENVTENASNIDTYIGDNGNIDVDDSEINYEEIYNDLERENLEQGFKDIDITADPEALDNALSNFTEKNWEDLSLDEQKESMSNLADYVVDVIGFKNPPNIEYYNNPEVGDYGGYDSSTNTLSVNEYMLYDSNEAADTIAHELWHAHQHECAENPQCALHYQYQYNFDNYISPDLGMNEYQAQLVEAEARAFAAQFKDRLADIRGRQ